MSLFFSRADLSNSANGLPPMPSRALRLAASMLGTLWLSGCMYAPGLNMSASLPDPQANPYSITTQRTNAASSDGVLATDAPPAGAMVTITPDLIRRQRAAQATDVGQDVKRLFGVAQPYSIGPGDVLNIVVWDHPELAIAPAGSSSVLDASSLSPVGNGYNVSPGGMIQFPYVGVLKVGGLTEYQARDEITSRLSKYLKDPQVTVRIQSYRSGRVYIDGEVRLPGLQALNDVPMTLPEAIGRAGGFLSTADRSTVSISRNGTTTVINMHQLTAFGVNPSSILLGNGDLVRVLSRDDTKVYVMGEVLRPVAQILRNGRLSLNEALGDAGGISPVSGDPQQIYVVRANGGVQPEIYHLDASTPTAYALADGFELKPRDVVYVDPAPLVRWNRVISLVLPSAQVVNVSSDIAKR